MYKVLIIEDEDLIRKGLIYTFKWQEYDCVVVGEASNGLEGMQMIEELEPDIVLTDIKMPLMDGIEMLSKFNDRDFEVLIISGYAEFDYARKAVEYQVSDYLLKPIDHKVLASNIEKITHKLKDKKVVGKVIEEVKNLKDYELIDVAYFNSSKYKFDLTTKVIAYISENYDKKITISEVANCFNTSKTKLAKEFKEDTKHTFNDFLNKFRIQKAIELMFEGEMLVYEVATEVGYSDYKYFSGVFKNYIGYTPTEFVKKDVIILKK